MELSGLAVGETGAQAGDFIGVHDRSANRVAGGESRGPYPGHRPCVLARTDAIHRIDVVFFIFPQ